NLAVKEATSPIIGFLNQRIVVEPDAIRQLLNGMIEPIALIGPQTLYSGRRLRAADGIVNGNDAVRSFGRLDQPMAAISMNAREVDFCPGACLARRELLAEL